MRISFKYVKTQSIIVKNVYICSIEIPNDLYTNCIDTIKQIYNGSDELFAATAR